MADSLEPWVDEPSRREFSISPVRVEVRLYRRSRSASCVSQKPSHLEYFLQCHLTGEPKESGVPSLTGWDELPSCYEIRRRWPDIVKFHESLVAELGCKKAPDLPSPDLYNTENFVQSMAATGDACALSKGRLNEEDVSHKELFGLHTVYIEKYLQPYFAEVSAILKDIPPEVLCSSKAFRQFATGGPSSLARKKTFGALEPASLEAASKAMRETWRKAARAKKTAASEPPATILPSVVTPAVASSPKARTDSSYQDGYDSSPSSCGGTLRSRAVKMPDSSPGKSPSHYQYFATSIDIEPEVFGALSEYELVNKMMARERREQARNTLLDQPALRPTAPGGRTLKKRGILTRSSPILMNAGTRLVPIAHTVTPNHRPDRNLRLETMMVDICAGVRTIILGEDPPKPGNEGGNQHNKRNQPLENSTDDRFEGSQRDVLVVYRTYRRLLGEELPMRGRLTDGPEDTEDSEEEDSEEETDEQQRQRRNDQERMAFVRDLGVCPELMPISWQTVFNWIDRKSDLAEDCRVKSTCQALLRALKDWRQFEASVAQSYLGVSLNMLFQWLWPCALYNNCAQMLTWIGQHEFQKIRQPTPEVVSKDDREQLEAIFKVLDVHDRGFITAEDLAGGPSQDSATKSKNIVDVDTVKAVYGGAPIRLVQFLEIMCEDNFRGHDAAAYCQLEDGHRLVYVERNVTDCRGWVYQDAPKSEETQRALIEAVELEIERWKSFGLNHRRAILNNPTGLSIGSVFKRGSIDPMEHLPLSARQDAIKKTERLTLSGSAFIAGGTIGGTFP